MDEVVVNYRIIGTNIVNIYCNRGKDINNIVQGIEQLPCPRGSLYSLSHYMAFYTTYDCNLSLPEIGKIFSAFAKHIGTKCKEIIVNHLNNDSYKKFELTLGLYDDTEINNESAFYLAGLVKNMVSTFKNLITDQLKYIDINITFRNCSQVTKEAIKEKLTEYQTYDCEKIANCFFINISSNLQDFNSNLQDFNPPAPLHQPDNSNDYFTIPLIIGLAGVASYGVYKLAKFVYNKITSSGNNESQNIDTCTSEYCDIIGDTEGAYS